MRRFNNPLRLFQVIICERFGHRWSLGWRDGRQRLSEAEFVNATLTERFYLIMEKRNECRRCGWHGGWRLHGKFPARRQHHFSCEALNEIYERGEIVWVDSGISVSNSKERALA